MKSIKKILAPTDFSDRATRALRYAVSLAQETDAKLFVLHAYQVPGGVTGTHFPMTGLYADTLVSHEQIVKEVQNDFKKTEDIHLKGSKVPYEFIDRFALPEDAIVEFIEEEDIDLVVMGNRGDSRLEKLLGSTTFRLMSRTSCPILTIPENAIFTKVDSILFATDFQLVDQPGTFQGLLSLADAFHAQIDVLHISESDEKLSSNKLSVGASLDRIIRSVPHSYHHYDSDDVLEGLQSYLDRHQEVGIVAVMPRDHTVWERLTKVSVTRQVVFEADRPVLVFRGNH